MLRAGTNVRPRLGRSQVVRQRFLVSPCAGSNPAAPTSQSVFCRAGSPLCGISPGFRGFDLPRFCTGYLIASYAIKEDGHGMETRGDHLGKSKFGIEITIAVRRDTGGHPTDVSAGFDEMRWP